MSHSLIVQVAVMLEDTVINTFFIPHYIRAPIIHTSVPETCSNTLHSSGFLVHSVHFPVFFLMALIWAQCSVTASRILILCFWFTTPCTHIISKFIAVFSSIQSTDCAPGRHYHNSLVCLRFDITIECAFF